MAIPALQVPPMECPAVLLPTPANLSNLFGGLATHAYRYEIDSLKDTLDTFRKFLKAYDPSWEKLSIPEKEWEIMIQRLIEEYPMYVQAQIMSLISSFVSFNLPLLGLQIDVLKLATDRSYLTELLASIKDDELDRLYALLPSEYKLFNGEYGLENAELKGKQIVDYIKNEATKFMNGQLFSGFDAVIGAFQEIWNALNLPALPVPLDLDIKAMIDAAIADAKDDAAKLAALKNIKIAGFDVMALLGGEFTDNVESLEFQIARIQTKLKEFKENYQLFLLKEWMGKVTAFFDAIGLSALTQYATLDFCTFMGLMGVPTTIDLSSFEGITQVANEVQSLDDNLPESD